MAFHKPIWFICQLFELDDNGEKVDTELSYSGNFVVQFGDDRDLRA